MKEGQVQFVKLLMQQVLPTQMRSMQFKLLVICRLAVPFIDSLREEFEKMAQSIRQFIPMKIILIRFLFNYDRRDLAYDFAREVIFHPINESKQQLEAICSFW